MKLFRDSCPDADRDKIADCDQGTERSHKEGKLHSRPASSASHPVRWRVFLTAAVAALSAASHSYSNRPSTTSCG